MGVWLNLGRFWLFFRAVKRADFGPVFWSRVGEFGPILGSLVPPMTASQGVSSTSRSPPHRKTARASDGRFLVSPGPADWCSATGALHQSWSQGLGRADRKIDHRALDRFFSSGEISTAGHTLFGLNIHILAFART